jgi:hypothetical protein
MGRLASSVRLRIEKQEHVMAVVGNGDSEHTGGQASRCPPYAPALWRSWRRVDDAFFIHRCGDCLGYLLMSFVKLRIKKQKIVM